jgi:cytochrome c-type biogenesis protein CcmE
MSSSTLAKVALTAAVGISAVGFFFYSSKGHTSRYKMVDQVMVAPGQWMNKPMQIHGWVEPGSIQEDIVAQETVRTFVLEHNGQRIMVRNKGPKPDSFRDRSEVVAEGKIVDENGQPVMIATGLMAKCPSKYQGASKDKLFDQ